MYDRMTVMEFLTFGAAFYGAEKDISRINHLLDVFDLDPARKIPELSKDGKIVKVEEIALGLPPCYSFYQVLFTAGRIFSPDPSPKLIN